jgi:hypothetical protein
MTDLVTIPIYRDRGIINPGMIGQPTPRGSLIGAIVIDEDAMIFEAYHYSCRPMLIGRAGSLRQAISIFHSKKGPPRPPSRRFDRFINKR